MLQRHTKKWIPLDVSHGGTGANSLDDAKTNLQIPEGGLTKAMTLNAPGGAVDGKYYPVIIDTSAMNGSGAMLCPVEIKTAGGPASNPLNSNSFLGSFDVVAGVTFAMWLTGHLFAMKK